MADVSALSPPTANAVGPGSVVLDIFVRAVKTAVSTFVGILGANVAGWTNISGVKNAGVVALAAGASVIVNVILSWSNTP